MDLLPLHPKLVHLPIALAVLMPMMSVGLLIAWWRQWLPRRAWVIAVTLQALLVASGVAAMRSGDADGERVERVVSESRIEAHEEAAEVFVWGAAAVLALAIGAALVRAEGAARPIATLAAAGTLVVLFLGYRTGQAGGELVYRHGAASAFTSAQGLSPAGEAPTKAGERRDDDD